jgi:hypothetical protein
MRTGMPALLAILRGNEPAMEPDWDAVLKLAQEEHVLPLAAHRLLQSGHAQPEAIPQRLLLEQRDATLTAFFWTAQLTGLLREFAAAGIEVILLKGPSLAERIYGGAALRVSRDLDLLVRKGDYGAAEALLARVGFTPSARPDDYHRQWHRGTAVVELHFDIENPLAIDFHIAGAWQQSQESVFNGQPCRLLAPADELLFLCIHGVRHRFERLSLVMDIALAMERLGGSAVVLRREVEGLRRLIALGCALARHLQPGVRCEGEVPQRMQLLADELWQHLMEATPPALDWQAQHAFFLRTELTVARRLVRRAAHLRIAATRLIDADFEFAARFGLRKSWQAWLLRPFRLLFMRRRC